MHRGGGPNNVAAQLAPAAGGAVAEPLPIRELRRFSNYLSPRGGVSGDTLALVSAFLRNLVLNWAVILPLLVALLLVPRALASWVILSPDEPWTWIAAAIALLGAIVAVTPVIWWALFGPQGAGNQGALWGTPLLLWVPAGVMSLAVTILVAWYLCSFESPAELLERVKKWMADRWSGGVGNWLAAELLKLVEKWGEFVQRIVGPGIVAVTVFLLSVLIVAVIVFVLFLLGAAGTNIPPFGAWGWMGIVGTVASFASGCLLGLGIWWLERVKPSPMQGMEAFGFWSWYLVLAPAAVLLVMWIGARLYDLWRASKMPPGESESLVRTTGYWLALAIGWVLLALLVLKLPVWLLGLPVLGSLDTTERAAGATALLGVLTAAIGYWSRHGPAVEQRVRSLLSTIGLRLQEALAVVFLVLLLVTLSYATAALISSFDRQHRQRVESLARDWAHRLALERLQQDFARSYPDRAVPERWACADEERKPLYGGCATPAQIAARRYEVELVAVPRFEGIGFPVPPAFYPPLAAALLVVGAMLVSLFFGVNRYSLGEIYARRLTRAYLGASRTERNPDPLTDYDNEDDLPLATLRTEDGKVRLPLLVINAALNCVRDVEQHPSVRDRRAESFVMTPLRCGSATLDYAPTGQYCGGGGITVGRAMAVSGAAASPNMGYHTSAAVGLVLGLFNIRLGAWLPNPKKPEWGKQEPSSSLRALVDEWLTRPSLNTPFVNVTDGGHFDNLGLYEMVRRRCPRIIVVDATCDPDYEYTDLSATMRKIRVDFGIEIEFPKGLPGPSAPEGAKSGPDAAGACIAIGHIRYRTADGPDAPDGLLYYLKPVLDYDMPQDLKDYARETHRRGRRFPQQPTWDQFYDEAQFESYRRLGLHCALKAFPGEGLWPNATHVAALRASAAANAPSAELPPATGGAAAAASLPDGLFERAKKFVQAMSPGEVLASAAALAGAITVTGTVTLADRTVTLADRTVTLDDRTVTLDDRTVTLDGRTVNLADTKVQLDKVSLDTLNSLRDAIDKKPDSTTENLHGLTWHVNALSKRIGSLQTKIEGTKPDDQNLVRSLTALKDSVDALKRAIGSGDTTNKADDLLTQVNKAREALKEVGALAGTFASTAKAATDLTSRLNSAGGAASSFETEAKKAAKEAKDLKDAALRLAVTNEQQAHALRTFIEAVPKLAEHLDNIAKEVKQLPPTRAIRGTPEGVQR